jgi:hypothetical protein
MLATRKDKMEINRINPMKSALQNVGLIQTEPKGTGAGAAMHGETLLAGLLLGDETPAGAMLREVQAAAVERQAVEDIRLCRKLAQLLRRRMESDGREVNDTTERDAAAAGVVAVVQWRSGVLPSPIVTSDKTPHAVNAVAWRAIVAEMSADTFGSSVELSSVSEDWLLAACDPLAVACVGGLESRYDKVTRWMAERGAVRRKARVLERLELFKAGAGARRRELIDKTGRACLLLVGGYSLDSAAAQAGFKAAGRSSAGDRLAQAVRALGVGVQFNLRQHVTNYSEPDALRHIDNGQRYQPHAVFCTVQAAV